MLENKKKIIMEAGINYEEASERFMGNEDLMVSFWKRFEADDNFEKLKAAIQADDREAAFESSHTLKGVCGNLSFTRLFELFSQQVALQRGEKWEEAAAMMPEIQEEYNRIVKIVASL